MISSNLSFFPGHRFELRKCVTEPGLQLRFYTSSLILILTEYAVSSLEVEEGMSHWGLAIGKLSMAPLVSWDHVDSTYLPSSLDHWTP